MPRLSTPHKRDRQLNIALYPEELALLQAGADAQGQRLVDYSRMLLLGVRAATSGVALPSRLERLNLEQLKRIGNNLNQIARQLHALGHVVPGELSANLDAVRELLISVASDDS